MKAITYLARTIALVSILGAAACQIDRTTGPAVSTASDIVPPNDRPAFALNPSGTCTGCRVGPITFERTTGAPKVETLTFATQAGVMFVVDLDDLGSQGADASVTLNGITLLGSRGTANQAPRHYQETIALQSENTLEVRLVGKPGSKLRVAIWPVTPITIDDVELPSGPSLQLSGPSATYRAVITNHTAEWTPPFLFLYAHIQQGDVSRETWYGPLEESYSCAPGVSGFPPGSCTLSGHMWATNSPEVRGTGTLVPGPANLVVGISGFDTFIVPITLLAPRPGWVYVDAPQSTIVVGAQAQLTVRVVAGDGVPLPDEPVSWSSGNSAIATVSPSGLVTGVSPGTVSISANTYAPMKFGTVQVTVVAP